MYKTKEDMFNTPRSRVKYLENKIYGKMFWAKIHKTN